MTEQGRTGFWRSPRRDYLLLPLIFFATIAVILVSGEVVTRMLYVQDDAAEPCEYHTAGGYRYKPNCTSRTKVWEGPWITQHFNDCGYRTAESCAPRPPGSLRVAVLGSSTARGALVNYDQSFAAIASADLSRRCGGMVDFQNLGTEPPDVQSLDRRIPEALALGASAIVITIGSFDLAHFHEDAPPEGSPEQPAGSMIHEVVNLLRESRLFSLMQYHLYRDRAFQVRAFLLNQDSADYVRTPLSQAWRDRVADISGLLARISAETTPIGAPVLLVYIPGRAPAALATMKDLPPGVDPYVLGAAVSRLAAAHGIGFVDTTEDMAKAPDFDSLFYLTDGHPSGEGHAAIARGVERKLLAEPVFARCAAPGNLASTP
jgi:hypothetical protein